MMAVDAYKWMLTPNGAGFVYVSKETREWLKPANIGWRSHWDWRSVDNLHHGAPRFSDQAEKYEGNPVFRPETEEELKRNDVVPLGPGGVFYDPA